jgi:galactosamine-6-phosphate isomerase
LCHSPRDYLTKLGLKAIEADTASLVSYNPLAMRVSIWVGDSYEAMSRQAAERILAALAGKPDLLLCAAGGSTPTRTYQLLAEYHAREPSTFRSLRVLKLDEWGGIGMDAPGACEAYLQTHLIRPLGLQDGRFFGFNSSPADPEQECERIRRRLAAEGPIDLCVLGLGVNGHIALNEPAPSLQPTAHVARLAEVSLRHPMLASAKTVPTYGLTLGMAEIFTSREILLLVSGVRKRAPLQRLLRREISTAFPASFLWLHPNWTLLCDRDAAAGLDLKP